MTAPATRAEALIAIAPVIAVLVVIVSFALLAIYGMPPRPDFLKPWANRRPGDLNGGRRP